MFVLFDYMIESLLDMHILDYSIMFDVWNTFYDAYGLMICLLSMYEVMGLHMYIALVDID